MNFVAPRATIQSQVTEALKNGAGDVLVQDGFTQDEPEVRCKTAERVSK